LEYLTPECPHHAKPTQAIEKEVLSNLELCGQKLHLEDLAVEIAKELQSLASRKFSKLFTIGV